MTKIEWTHRPGTKGERWNPVKARNKKTGGIGHFCTKVSKGCNNCYAANFQPRFKNPVRYAKQDADQVEIFLDEKTLIEPLHWKKPRTIFACSMTDVFHELHEYKWLHKILGIAALCPQHTFIFLTKRPEAAFEQLSEDDDACYEIALEAADLIPSGYNLTNVHIARECGEWRLKSWPLPNVWLGVSVEDQETADERIPILLKTPAEVRFISAEPLLGPISFEGRFVEHPSTAYHVNWAEELDWVICGGESGHKANPMHPDWARTLRDQCIAADTPFFFKQWGAWACTYDRDIDDPDWRKCPRPTNNRERYINLEGGHGFHGERVVFMNKVSKKEAGRELDGRQHNEWPRTAA